MIPRRGKAVQGQAGEPRDQQVHGIRGQQGQDAQEEEPPMAAQEWPNVLQELADGAPHIV